MKRGTGGAGGRGGAMRTISFAVQPRAAEARQLRGRGLERFPGGALARIHHAGHAEDGSERRIR